MENAEQNEILDEQQTDAPIVFDPFDVDPIDVGSLKLEEEMIKLNRVAKVVKGGRRFSFCALMAVGDGAGHIGIGYGKANEVPAAIAKGVDQAKRNLARVWLKGSSIPHEVVGRFGSARVMLKPASEGTGIIAGTAVRQVLELAGVHNILTKSLGSSNVINVVKATAEGLTQLRRADQIAALRGKTLEDMLGRKLAKSYREQQLKGLAPEGAIIEGTQDSGQEYDDMG